MSLHDTILPCHGSIYIRGVDESLDYIQFGIYCSEWEQEENYNELVKQLDPRKDKYISDTGETWACFDNWWQAGKLYDEVKPIYVYNWWKKQTSSQQTYPLSDSNNYLQNWKLCSGGCRSKVYWCECDKYDTISARKNVLIPQYAKYILQSEAIQKLREMIAKGINITIIDFQEKSNEPQEFDWNIFKKRLDDPFMPLSYGIIIASLLTHTTNDE